MERITELNESLPPNIDKKGDDEMRESLVDIDPETHMNQMALKEMIVTTIRQKLYLITEE